MNETPKQKLQAIKQKREKEKSVGSEVELIPFAWRNPIEPVDKKSQKILTKLMFEENSKEGNQHEKRN